MRVQQTLPAVNVLNCVNIRSFHFYGTKTFTQSLIFLMFVVEWTLFITKCNAIDNRWFACLHLGCNCCFCCDSFLFVEIPSHSHIEYTRKHAHCNIFCSSLIIDQKCRNWHTEDSKGRTTLYAQYQCIYFGILFLVICVAVSYCSFRYCMFFFSAWKENKTVGKMRHKWMETRIFVHSIAQHRTAEHKAQEKTPNSIMNCLCMMKHKEQIRVNPSCA